MTAAREQASELRARLESLGAEVLELPAIRIEPIDDRAAGSRGVRLARVHVGERRAGAVRAGLAPWASTRARSDGCSVAAIGPGTAAAFAARGITPDLMPERYVAESLARGVPRPRRHRATGCCSRAPRSHATCCPTGCEARGYSVEVLPVYRTVQARARGVGARRRCATATSTRSRSRRRRPSPDFCDLVGALPDPQPTVVSIGPVTSETARARGLRVDAEADEHTIDGLVTTLVASLTVVTSGSYELLRPTTDGARDASADASEHLTREGRNTLAVPLTHAVPRAAASAAAPHGRDAASRRRGAVSVSTTSSRRSS